MIIKKVNQFVATSTKPLCYVLVYSEFDIIKKSLESICSLAEMLDIVVIENPSENTKKIKKYVNELGKQGMVQRYYKFNKNISNNAYEIVLRNEIEAYQNAGLVVVTDGDLTLEDGSSWLDETKKILDKEEVFCCGASMHLENLPLSTFPDAKSWIPKATEIKADYDVARTGCHFLAISGHSLANFLGWLEKEGGNFTDRNIYEYCSLLGKNWARTKKNKVYHLTWDLYSDPDSSYTKFKSENSFEELWYHNRKARYKLYLY